jgi:hypothetical protein
MITGLLFTLAARAERQAVEKTGEGNPFPQPPPPKPEPQNDVVKVAHVAAGALTLTGLALLGIGGLDWTFDPAIGLKVQTAFISFTLPAGVFS